MGDSMFDCEIANTKFLLSILCPICMGNEPHLATNTVKLQGSNMKMYMITST